MSLRTQNQILEALACQGAHGADWGALLAAQDASMPEFVETLRTLEKNQEVVIRDGRVMPRRPLTAAYPTHQCRHCSGKGFAVATDDALLAKFNEVTRDRPGPNLNFDQGYITPEDAVIRASFMRERGDLHQAEILMVGDFDLSSLALALTGLPKRIVVLDIDTRVIAFVNRAAQLYHLPVEAMPFDVRHGLDPQLARRFDVFVCDPVETLPGIRLYLSRGAEALRAADSAAYFGLTTIEASRKKWFDIQGVLHGMGFAVTDIRRAFSGYPDHDTAPSDADFSYPIIDSLGAAGSQHRWYTSAFVRIEAVTLPVPAITGDSVLGSELYIDDEAWATPVAAR